MYEAQKTGIYGCCGCGRIFDEPIAHFDYSEYWGVGDYTDYYVSPCCKEPFDEVPEDEEESEEE